MNVKEPHVITGMSRDSAVSRQNPNLAYDAHNIRITTKDNSNSLLSVTNEKGTSEIEVQGVKGKLIGYTIVNNYLVLFTHNDEAPYDYIYRLKMPLMGEEVTISEVFEVFRGNAGFNINNPIQALAVYENDDLQKVYWVDGINQPRVVNIATKSTITNEDTLNFSREVSLHSTFTVTKFSTGGEFPVGTVQYAFSYYTKFGQESRLIDISPMYYLSPQENGLDATSIAHCSFSIQINLPDQNYDYVRIYAIVRTSANVVPQCRIVGDYAISADANILATDDGIKGTTYPASSMYFIGGEELIAGTLAEKDNTLFLGNIKLNRPNVGSIKITDDASIRDYVNGYIAGTIRQSEFYNKVGEAKLCASNAGLPYDSKGNVPTTATKYYDYNPNNNRSSYYVRRFKYLETYRLGFIAQYKNGQWSEPIWVGDLKNTYVPRVGAEQYSTGYYRFVLSDNLIDKLTKAGYRRVAPVVVYPQAHERTCVMQGLLCPTMYNVNDRRDNSPYAQSSWFFRMYDYVAPYFYHNRQPIGDSDTSAGEIQCIAPTSEVDTKTFCMDGNVLTFHSPDIECVDASQNVDMEGVGLRVVGFASASTGTPVTKGNVAKVTDHFLETENVGINTELSQIITMARTGYSDYSVYHYSYPLYFDSPTKNENDGEVEKRDELWRQDTEAVIANPACGWIVYPWHRQGSLNNQQALSTKQRSNGFNSRTAMLKRNITANAWFTNSVYFGNVLSLNPGVTMCTPKIFNYDQLASVKLSAGADSAIYYGNIDKVITSVNGKYPIYYGWVLSVAPETPRLPNLSRLSESAMSRSRWIEARYGEEDERIYTGTDPVSMKYKSSPHAVFKFTNSDLTHIPMFNEDHEYLAFSNDGDSKATGYGLYIAEFIRPETTERINNRFGGKSEQAFISNDWVRCGEAKNIEGVYTGLTIDFKQGDCYIQRYDCLKTYPFTNEDQNSVIETLSATLETYVNLDFRYDHNRGSGKNVALSPINFNLYNHPAYEQVNNFFTYHGLDYSRFSKNVFPNAVTWSLEKHLGEDIDTWASIDATNMAELDGSKGEVTDIVQFRNNLYAFQKGAFARLLFNNRVQIPTSDNNPIEITNGMKMQGVEYISEKIGCSNKWSIVETPLGIYFNDDELCSTYRFNGQLTDITSTKGLRTFMQSRHNNKPWNPADFNNCIAFYNKIGRDIYWVYDNECVSFSEQTDNYTSFMDYEGTSMMAEVNGNTFLWHGDNMHLMHGGDYNYFFGVHKPYWLTLISNSAPTENKIFNNLAWRDIMHDGTTPEPFHTFDHIRVWNENQDTRSVRLSNSLSESPSRSPVSYDAAVSNLRKKFNVWHCQIPRDKLSYSGRGRISNPWTYIKLSREDTQAERHEIMDIEVDYFM